jgi:hypothetical protein
LAHDRAGLQGLDPGLAELHRLFPEPAERIEFKAESNLLSSSVFAQLKESRKNNSNSPVIIEYTWRYPIDGRGGNDRMDDIIKYYT